MTRLLSLNELSRKTDVPYSTLLELTRRGELCPDALSSRFMLFNESRLGEITAFLNQRRNRNYANVPATIS